jgi:hypothetical protein
MAELDAVETVIPAVPGGRNSPPPKFPCRLVSHARRDLDTEPATRIAPDLHGEGSRSRPGSICQSTDHVRGAPTGRSRLPLPMPSGTGLPRWLRRTLHPGPVLTGNPDPLVPWIGIRVQARQRRDSRPQVFDGGPLFLRTRACETGRRGAEILAAPGVRQAR